VQALPELVPAQLPQELALLRLLAAESSESSEPTIMTTISRSPFRRLCPRRLRRCPRHPHLPQLRGRGLRIRMIRSLRLQVEQNKKAGISRLSYFNWGTQAAGLLLFSYFLISFS
jgi:hypothetical protein